MLNNRPKVCLGYRIRPRLFRYPLLRFGCDSAYSNAFGIPEFYVEYL